MDSQRVQTCHLERREGSGKPLVLTMGAVSALEGRNKYRAE